MTLHGKQPENFNPIFSVVGCFVQTDGKILLVHRLPHKSEGSTWGLIAGKIDAGEKPLEAMKRELREESGISAKNENLIYESTHYVRHAQKDIIYHTFSLRLDFSPAITLQTKEHDDYIWVTPRKALDMNLIHDLKEVIEEFFELTP